MQLKALMPDIYTLIPSDYASIRCREYERLLSLYMSRAVPSAHPRFVQGSAAFREPARARSVPAAVGPTVCLSVLTPLWKTFPHTKPTFIAWVVPEVLKNGKFRHGLSVMNCFVAPLKPERTFILNTVALTGRMYS